MKNELKAFEMIPKMSIDIKKYKIRKFLLPFVKEFKWYYVLLINYCKSTDKHFKVSYLYLNEKWNKIIWNNPESFYWYLVMKIIKNFDFRFKRSQSSALRIFIQWDLLINKSAETETKISKSNNFF